MAGGFSYRLYCFSTVLLLISLAAHAMAVADDSSTKTPENPINNGTMVPDQSEQPFSGTINNGTAVTYESKQPSEIITNSTTSTPDDASVPPSYNSSLDQTEDQLEAPTPLYSASAPNSDDLAPESSNPYGSLASVYPSSSLSSPSPSPSLEEFAPEIGDESGEVIPSPLEAPVETPSDNLTQFSTNEYSTETINNGTDGSDDDVRNSIEAPPFNYKAEYAVVDDDQRFEEESEGGGGWNGSQNEKGVKVMIGVVCVVGLAGLVYSKKKTNKKYARSKADYEYQLTKRDEA